MPSTADTALTTLSLGRDNELEWSRLRRAIELTEGFALYLISVQDLSTAAELIRRLQHGFPDRTTHNFTVADKTRLEVAELLQQMTHLPPEALVVLSELEEQKLPTDFWVRFNERRNLWQRHSPHAHLWFVNSSIRQQIRTQAPDIYSIRSLDFLFTLPPSVQERFSERISTPTSPWLGTADSLMAEANLFAMDQTPTGRLLYGRALLSLAQRLRLEGQLDEALKVTQGGELGYLEQVAHRDKRYAQVILFFEEALSIFRAVHDPFSQARALQDQGESLGALKLQVGAFAALWQAREIFHAIQAPSAAALDEIFARLEQEHPKDYTQLIADLQMRAEELRQEAVAAVREASADAPLLQKISAAVRSLLAPEDRQS